MESQYSFVLGGLVSEFDELVPVFDETPSELFLSDELDSAVIRAGLPTISVLRSLLNAVSLS